MGWHDVDVNEAGLADPVIGVLPERIDAFQWHYYGFELPAGAELLAGNEAASRPIAWASAPGASSFIPR